MKQLLQNLKDGTTEVAEVPCPRPGRGHLLVRTTRTLVSAGTERMVLDFGRASLIDKARQQPDKVRMVLDKVRTDGLMPTIEAVRNKLDQPVSMGYCNVGEVVEVGAGVHGFARGDRVASNGRHAEMVSVPVNLCAAVPDGVSDDQAAFTVLGAIALQGIRLVQPTLGETVVVTGLGLIGLLTVQLLKAQGCRVLGLDFDAEKLDLARRFGAEGVDLGSGVDPVRAAMAFSRGRGVDAVLITASTRSNEPVHQAAQMCRKRGRIVLVGVTGLELSRADFYEKELSFQVSCSYGPGRYDPLYEDKGQDYPVGFVRWTEQRNFEAVLDMLREGRVDVKPLVTHRFELAQCLQAYAVVGGTEPSLGIVLHHADPSTPPPLRPTVPLAAGPMPSTARAGATVGFIGAGNYAGAVLIPAFAASGARLHTLVSLGGLSSVHLGRRHRFEQAGTDVAAVWRDPNTNVAVVSTRHDSHATLVLAARAAGKHVWVEKPLCTKLEDLTRIERAYGSGDGSLLMVGFNRRFSPHVRRMRSLLAATPGPKCMIMTVNAGAIAASHWTQDRIAGGGRVIGEACHFIDLLRHIAGCRITSADARAMKDDTLDSVSLSLSFADGSIGTVHYIANGNRGFPKERLEVFAGGRILQLDNFRRLTGYGWSNFSSQRLWRQDKGQRAAVAAFVAAVRGSATSPIPLDELIEVTRVSIELSQRLQVHQG